MASTPRPSQPDEKDLGPDDSISMVSTSTVNGNQSYALQTPTSSSIATSNRSKNIPYITRNSAPGPDYTYIIVDKSGGENEALAIIGGDLHLATPFELLPNPPVLDSPQARAFAGNCNWHWHCEERDGWLGFQNAATGQWLGSAVPHRTSTVVEIRATASSLGVTEQFCARKETDCEGYVLLKRMDIKGAVYLMPVGYSNILAHALKGCPNFVHASMTHVEKTTWEFVRVDRQFIFYTGSDVDPLEL